MVYSLDMGRRESRPGRGTLMRGDLHRVLLWLLGFIAVVGTLYYVFVHRNMKKPDANV